MATALRVALSAAASGVSKNTFLPSCHTGSISRICDPKGTSRIRRRIGITSFVPSTSSTVFVHCSVDCNFTRVYSHSSAEVLSPQLAVAYDFEFHDCHTKFNIESMTCVDSRKETAATNVYPPPLSVSASPFIVRTKTSRLTNADVSYLLLEKRRQYGSGSGGGGSGGRHQCPKCGANVIFRHGEFNENSFYCAACSGWFVVESKNNTTITTSDSRSSGGDTDVADSTGVGQHIKPQTSSSVSATTNKLQQPNNVPLRDVSDENTSNSQQQTKIYSTRTHPQQPQSNFPPGMQYPSTAQYPPNSIPNGYRIGSNLSNKAALEDYGQILPKDTSKNTIPIEIRHMKTPKEIMKGLDEYVIGQRNVKMALAVGVYNHCKRIFVAEAFQHTSNNPNFSESTHQQPQKPKEDISITSSSHYYVDGKTGTSTPPQVTTSSLSTPPFCETPVEDEMNVNIDYNPDTLQDFEDCEIEKSNIILLGPTGSGKTFLVKTLARLIDVPLVIADATSLTQAGYVGEDAESILYKLYLAAGQDIERTQRGIVYIDEIDKIRKSDGNVSISRDVSGEGVQHALLKIVEGNIIHVSKEQGRRNQSADFLKIDTTNILFICGGAYSGLERIISRRMDVASIGFNAAMKKNVDDAQAQGKSFDHAIPRDLVDYGMIPEFVGRFPVITTTRGLDIDNLCDILTKPKNSIMKQYRRLFAMDDITFHVTEDALKEIAKTAFTRGTGARGLRSISESILLETQYVVPSMADVHTVYLDGASVRGERKPILLKDPQMTVEKFEELMQAKHESQSAIDGNFLVDGAVHVDIDQPDEAAAA